MSDSITSVLENAIEKHQGLLKLRPNFVHRFYPDARRMNQQASPLAKKARYLPERWIASTVRAINPDPIPNEGLSILDLPGAEITLKQALELQGKYLLGEKRYQKHGGDFLVLTKILDPGIPIVFHLHASDQQVKSMPGNFTGHRFGKDEAYYFLSAPKGPCPYNHIGLYPWVEPDDLLERIELDDGSVLETSPCFLQNYGEGAMTPASLPHRPGTALTLEIQQPSDVYTLLEMGNAGESFSPEQQHPGFESLSEALELIDFDLATDPDLMDNYRIIPKPDGEVDKQESAEQVWIYPPDLCKKFMGKRLRVFERFTSCEAGCYALLVWQGYGRFNGHPISAGEEYFVSAELASRPVVIENTGNDLLELFKIIPPDPDEWVP